MAINLSDNIKVQAPKPADSRYLNITVPYTGTSQVNAIIPSGERYLGLTVLINGPETGSINKEYWYKDSVGDLFLIVKTMGGTSVLSGATNGLHLINSGTTVSLGGLLTQNTVFSGGTGYTLQYAADYSASFTDRSLIDKGYANAILSGLKPKEAVNLATTTNITLSGNQLIDGVMTTDGMRILVKNQNNSLTGDTANGVYSASTVGWVRTQDFDGTPFGEVVSGSYIFVLSGATNANSSWVLATADPITVGVTPLLFVLFNHVTDVVSGPGITVVQSGGTHTVSVNTFEGGLTATMSGLKLGGDISGSTVITDLRPIKRGIEYGGDYTTGFSANSLITKQFAESLVASGGTYNLDSPSVCPVGGLCVGTTLTGKTAFEILSEILVPVVQPSISPEYSNSIVLSPASGSVCEIGCVIGTLSVTSNFNRGAYVPAYCGGTPFRTGLPTCHIFTGTGVAGTTGTTSLSVPRSTASYTVLIGTQSWTTNVAFSAGLQSKSSKGANSTIPPVASGTSGVKTATIVGAYPIFGTTSTINTLTKQTIQNMSTANNIQVNLVAETGGFKQKFQIPCAWLGAPTNRPLNGICQWNTVSSIWEFPGGSAGSSLTIWNCGPASETVQGNPIGYCEYTFNGVDRSNVCIRLVF